MQAHISTPASTVWITTTPKILRSIALELERIMATKTIGDDATAYTFESKLVKLIVIPDQTAHNNQARGIAQEWN